MMVRLLLSLIAVALTAASTARAKDAEILSIYNWSDYIAKDTIKRFEAETGIKVQYAAYNANKMLESKLQAGHSGYDVVFAGSPFLAHQIGAGFYQKLDKSKLGNYGNLDREILAVAADVDPDNEFGVPYLWGTTAIAYNPAEVKKALGAEAPTDSLRLIFYPPNAHKLADCGLSLLDTPQEMLPAALAYFGRDPLSRDEVDLVRAGNAVTVIRSAARQFRSPQYISDLANGKLCAAFGYSGDLVQARNRAVKAKKGVTLTYRIPKEGAMMWIDMMAIPKDAPHPENALKFIDFILRPEIVAQISNAVGYANPNTRATELVDKQIRNDPVIYPPPEVRAKLFFDKPVSPQYEELRSSVWARVKLVPTAEE